jgi:hypothetical protein
MHVVFNEEYKVWNRFHHLLEYKTLIVFLTNPNDMSEFLFLGSLNCIFF